MIASWILRRNSTGGKLQRFDSADYFAQQHAAANTGMLGSGSQRRGLGQGNPQGIDSLQVYETQTWLESVAPGLRQSNRRADITLRITELCKIRVKPLPEEVLGLFPEAERAELIRAVPADRLDWFCRELAQQFLQQSRVKHSQTSATKAESSSRNTREPITFSQVA